MSIVKMTSIMSFMKVRVHTLIHPAKKQTQTKLDEF